MNTKDIVFLYGASGHAKVVRDIAKQVGLTVQRLIDDNPAITSLEGIPVVHSAEGLSPIIVTIGDCQIRRKIVEKLGYREYTTVVHPKAIVSDSVIFGCGTVVMAGAILNPYASIGNQCIINTGASIDHDCKIHDFVHIAPHCTLCGEVEVGEGTWVGAGTTVIQGIHIGKNCIIGAGTVVIKDIPDNSVVAGVPAHIIRKNE